MAKRKNTKKSKKDLEKIESVGGFDTDLSTKLAVIFSVIVCFTLFYLLTIYITNKNTKKTEKEDETVKISYNTTIVGRSLSMSDGEYLVVFYDKTSDEDKEIYSDFTSRYNGELKIYTVDMSSGFNKSYKTDETSNRTPESEQDFLINGFTLIKVSDHKVVEYIEGKGEINDYLG